MDPAPTHCNPAPNHAQPLLSANVGTLVIFHHMPERTDDQMDDIALAADKTRPGTVVAREGMTLTP